MSGAEKYVLVRALREPSVGQCNTFSNILHNREKHRSRNLISVSYHRRVMLIPMCYFKSHWSGSDLIALLGFVGHYLAVVQPRANSLGSGSHSGHDDLRFGPHGSYNQLHLIHLGHKPYRFHLVRHWLCYCGGSRKSRRWLRRTLPSHCRSQ